MSALKKLLIELHPYQLQNINELNDKLPIKLIVTTKFINVFIHVLLSVILILIIHLIFIYHIYII